MDKVFSAKRKTISFYYEFLDGTTATLNARTLSTKEQLELGDIPKNVKEGVEYAKKLVKTILAGNDINLVEKLINEQYENGDLIEFSASIQELILKVKEKK